MNQAVIEATHSFCETILCELPQKAANLGEYFYGSAISLLENDTEHTWYLFFEKEVLSDIAFNLLFEENLCENDLDDLLKEIANQIIGSAKVLLEENAYEVGGVLHCYNASKHLLDLAHKGFYFGIGGVLTFKNAKNLIEVLPLIPKDKLLLETDAPYLTPMPYRGERNEPAYTLLVAQKMSELLNISVTELHNLTSKNAFTLFKALEKIKLDTI